MVLDFQIGPAGDAVTVGPTLEAMASATPHDGEHLGEAGAGADQYGPIWTTADAVLIGAPVSRDGVEQSRMVRLDAALTEQENVQLKLGSIDPSSWGHRAASVAATDGGTVFATPSDHGSPWDVRYTTTPNDLSTLTATTSPLRSHSRADYDRFHRAPDGTVWHTARVQPSPGTTADMALALSRWDDTTSQFVSVQDPLTVTDGPYSAHLAWADDGTMFLALSWFLGGGSGGPRNHVTVVKSSDEGASWTDLLGNALAVPFDSTAASRAFDGEVFGSSLAVNSSGHPVVVSIHEDELKIARWTGSGFWTSTLLTGALTTGTREAGRSSIASHGDTVVVAAADADYRADPDWGGVPQGPIEPRTIHLFLSTSGGAHFTRYTVAVPGDGWNMGALDPQALRVNGVARLLLFSIDNPARSEVWDINVSALV